MISISNELGIKYYYLKIICVFDGDHESDLHYEFKDKCIGGEWFMLGNDDLSRINHPDFIESIKSNRFQSFTNHIGKRFGESSKTVRDLIDWKSVSNNCGIHYNTLLNYLRGFGMDRNIMDEIIRETNIQLKKIKEQLPELV